MTKYVVISGPNTGKHGPEITMSLDTFHAVHCIGKVFISSGKKKNPKLNPVIRRVNDQLRKLCEINGFLLINNDMITTDHLWRDGIPLQDIGTNILSRNFYLVFHDFLYENHSWQQNLNKASEFVFDSDLKGLSKLRKDDPDNPIIGYLNINFLKEKNI